MSTPKTFKSIIVKTTTKEEIIQIEKYYGCKGRLSNKNYTKQFLKKSGAFIYLDDKKLSVSDEKYALSLPQKIVSLDYWKDLINPKTLAKIKIAKSTPVQSITWQSHKDAESITWHFHKDETYQIVSLTDTTCMLQKLLNDIGVKTSRPNYPITHQRTRLKELFNQGYIELLIE
jgi:hypothetical protein